MSSLALNFQFKSQKELKEFMADCQSIQKFILINGVKYPVWKRKAVLDIKGNPIPLEEFQKQEITLITPIEHYKFLKSEKKLAKASYEAAMKEFLGDNWKQVSKKYKIYNVPEKEYVRKEILKNIKQY